MGWPMFMDPLPANKRSSLNSLSTETGSNFIFKRKRVGVLRLNQISILIFFEAIILFNRIEIMPRS